MTETDTGTETSGVQQWFDLPPSATDWVRRGDRASFWLPLEPSESDEWAAWAQVTAWDAMVGRMVRACLFDESMNPRKVRMDSEAVAAVAESLAMRLGVTR